MIVVETRHFERLVHRRVGEYTAIRMLGNRLPRKIRRLMGRVYGNAGYRKNHAQPLHATGYWSYTPHHSIVDYVAAEAAKTMKMFFKPQTGEKVELPPLPALPEIPNVDASTETPSE